VQSDPDAGFTLVDCGSWVNVSRDQDQRAFWNSQVGLLTGGEVAVVQVDSFDAPNP